MFKKSGVFVSFLAATISQASLASTTLVGTWTGTLDDTTIPVGSPGYVDYHTTMQMVITSDNGTTLTGYWDWLTSDNDWAGCGTYPCTSTWISAQVTGIGPICAVRLNGE